MDENNRNMLLAILLSGLVLIGWHFFYAGPKLQEAQERERRLAAQKTAQSQTTAPNSAGTAVAPGAQPGGAVMPSGSPPVPGAAAPGGTVMAAVSRIFITFV